MSDELTPTGDPGTGEPEQSDDAAMRPSAAPARAQDAQRDVSAADTEPVSQLSPDDISQGEEEETVTDPGGRLQDIPDPALRSAVARLRGARGAARPGGAPRTHLVSPQDTGDRTVEPSAPAQSRRAVLTELMLTAKLPSDRIRAAEALRREEEEELAGHTDRASLFLAQRAMLEALPPHARLDWLRDERRREAGDDALDLMDWDEVFEAGPADAPTGGHPRAAESGTPADS